MYGFLGLSLRRPACGPSSHPYSRCVSSTCDTCHCPVRSLAVWRSSPRIQMNTAGTFYRSLKEHRSMYVPRSGIVGAQWHGSSGRLGSHYLETREINTSHRDTTRLIWDPSISRGRDARSWRSSRRDYGNDGRDNVRFHDIGSAVVILQEIYFSWLSNLVRE